jgi:hypothetical protein
MKARYTFHTEYDCPDPWSSDANGGACTAYSPAQAVLEAVVADVLHIPDDAEEVRIIVRKVKEITS